MSKEQGFLTKENAERILGQGMAALQLAVKGADGKPKISSLAKGVYRTATPEQVKAAQNGGIAVDWALLDKLTMLGINGPAKNVKDTEKAHEITMEAERDFIARNQALSMAKGGIER